MPNGPACAQNSDHMQIARCHYVHQLLRRCLIRCPDCVYIRRHIRYVTRAPGPQPGREMVAAGYCLYGSSCSMVLSVGGQPAHFTLDPSLGEFVLTSPQLAVPRQGSIYSVNEGNASLWDAATARCAGMPLARVPGHLQRCHKG